MAKKSRELARIFAEKIGGSCLKAMTYKKLEIASDDSFDNSLIKAYFLVNSTCYHSTLSYHRKQSYRPIIRPSTDFNIK
jgi:hypothetical protein